MRSFLKVWYSFPEDHKFHCNHLFFALKNGYDEDVLEKLLLSVVFESE